MQQKSVVKRSWLDRMTVKVALAIGILLVQYGLVMLFAPDRQHSGQLIFDTMVGCVAATIVAIFLIRGVSQYPGVEATAYIVPGFVIAYATLLATFILGRLEYSRILLTTSFLANVAFFFVIFSVATRRRRLRIGIVPEGQYGPPLEIRGIEWFTLRHSDDDVSHLDAIAVDLRADIPDEWDRRLAAFALSDMPVYHSKHLLESLTGKVELEHLSENSFGTLSPLRSYMSIKRLIDTLAAMIALIVLLPLLAMVALIIKFDSPGPALFRQVRVGYQGRPFRVFKFRTMTVASSLSMTNALDAAKTRDDDARVTRSGAFLRRSRLDELPQLINVIKGEMSWIGPRPEAEVLSQWYSREIPFYPYRHIVRPGITGWAQVNQGHVAEVEEVKSKLHYDFYYIKHFSPWIDLLIVARTIRTILTGFGAK